MPGTIKKNLTAVTWAHAINSQKLLDIALKSNLNMIEADIVLGTVNKSGPTIPIMGHPPATTSDISLEEFLTKIDEYNNLHSDHRKGVKLDFKTIEVFEASLDTLRSTIVNKPYPIWLNADIVEGPVEAVDTVPVDAQRFLDACFMFSDAVISIGFTTKWTAHYNDGFYSNQQIYKLLDAVEKSKVFGSGQEITIPVRAGIAANSFFELDYLLMVLNRSNKTTLTIWSSPGDFVHGPKLREFILSIGLDRVYLDVPASLSRQLNLPPAFTGRMDASSVLQCLLKSVGDYILSWHRL